MGNPGLCPVHSGVTTKVLVPPDYQCVHNVIALAMWRRCATNVFNKAHVSACCFTRLLLHSIALFPNLTALHGIRDQEMFLYVLESCMAESTVSNQQITWIQSWHMNASGSCPFVPPAPASPCLLSYVYFGLQAPAARAGARLQLTEHFASITKTAKRFKHSLVVLLRSLPHSHLTLSPAPPCSPPQEMCCDGEPWLGAQVVEGRRGGHLKGHGQLTG